MLSTNIVGEFCQPLGDQNVWGTLYPIKEPLAEKEVVMVAAKVMLKINAFYLCTVVISLNTIQPPCVIITSHKGPAI